MLDATVFQSRIGKQLGQGRFGQVFSADNPVYQRTHGSSAVALKIIIDEDGTGECREPFLVRLT